MSTALVPKELKDTIDRWCAKLAVSFQRKIDAATIQEYREALADLPAWAIEAAGLELKRKGGEFFPTTAKWHQLADAAIEAKRKELISNPVREQECEQCRDTGWVDVTQLDGRDVVVPCSCRPTNTNYQRMTAASRKANNEEGQ